MFLLLTLAAGHCVPAVEYGCYCDGGDSHCSSLGSSWDPDPDKDGPHRVSPEFPCALCILSPPFAPGRDNMVNRQAYTSRKRA